jgi:hypothetical protein
MVRFSVLLLALAWTTGVLADDRRPIQPNAPIEYVNLNAPRALEKLEESNPKHYETFAKILYGLNQRPYESVSRWIQTSFQATNVSYSLVLLTSDPPQRDLWFTIDGTQYFARVTLTADGARIASTKGP